ncbi:zinc-binding dehydrogenase [Paenibacillus sp. P26]|nr:zinc-binding dehydrogenase [Paenibacillus sp. P26]UUZ96288.1 zinc-binding dehydrogenase [Paenibacillus sp. P25]
MEGPNPSASEAVVKVKAFSLNGGEVRNALGSRKAWRPGWDLAGVVEQAVADGLGPPQGTRVVGLMESGAWAERVAVPTAQLAPIPDAVSFADAACLPVAGLTALYGLEKGGHLLGKSVLVTGASGGVGQLACQLAVRSGARVTALTRRAELAESMKRSGIRNIAASDDPAAAAQYGPYDLILEPVGGASLASSLKLLAPGGVCVLCGNASNRPTEFEARDFYLRGGTSLYGLFLNAEARHRSVSADLSRLAVLVEEGSLRPPIQQEASWLDIDRIARRLMDRSIWGKAVLHIGETG